MFQVCLRADRRQSKHLPSVQRKDCWSYRQSSEDRIKQKVAGVSLTKQTDEELQYPGSNRAKRQAGADQLSSQEL